MRRVLALRDFRLLWLSQAGSTIAERLVIVALALYVNEIGTPTDVGIVLASGTVSFVAFLLIGGVWADRLPRNELMVATDVIRGILHALLAVLILTGEPAIWVIVVIEFVFGGVQAFFRPAFTGLVPQTVPDELMQEAQAAIALTNNIAGVLGPAFAATLVVTIGAGAAFAIDALTFFVSAAMLIRITPRPRGEQAVRTRVFKEVAEGFAEVRSRPWVAAIIAMASLSLLFAIAPYQALGPDIADQEYGDAAVYGVIGAVSGVGTVIGTLLALRWKPARPLVIGTLATLPWSLEFLALSLGAPLPALFTAAFAAGLGLSLFIVWWETALVESIPPAALSRVSSFDWMGSLGLLPVGFILAGPIATEIGEQETLMFGSLITILFVAGPLCLRSVRDYEPKSGTPAVGVDASP